MLYSKLKGFTLIELLVTLSLATVFLLLVVPSYYNFIQNNKVIEVANKLSASFSLARTEAIKRGIRVGVCSAANSTLSSCGSNTQWAQGWIVFFDANQNNIIDSSVDLSKVNEALPTGVTVTSNTAAVIYDPSGFLVGNSVSITISAAGCKGLNARVLSIASSGRLSISRVSC